MKLKPIFLLPVVIALTTCQPSNNFPTQQTNTQTPIAKPTLNNTTITFNHTTGNYPVFDDGNYKTINDDITKLIQDLVEFDKQFDKEMIGGVYFLEYSTITHNNQLSVIIKYGVSDMTSRYFNKYYQIDLANKKQILLKDYLINHQINIAKINEKLNQFLDNCTNNQPPEQCNDISLGYLINTYQFDTQKIDIFNDNTGFYILDKDHIVVGFNSAKFTTSFKININTYQIETK